MSIETTLTELERYLKSNEVFFRKDHVLKYETWFKQGGKVKLFIEPQSSNHTSKVIEYLSTKNIDYKLIGFTSNLMFLDEICYSIIVSTKNLRNIDLRENEIWVESGYSLQDFVRITAMKCCSGFEGLEGIPGSIGGAIFMNAGAYGDEISDHLLSVRCINSEGKLVLLKKEECQFSYRNSIFKKESGYVILGASFRLVRGEKKMIEKKIETFHIARHSYQEFVYPTLGSMISIKGNSYKEFFRGDKLFSIAYYVLKLIYKNPVTKFIKRKSPDSIPFNRLLLIFIKKHGYQNQYKFSKKGANILINDGHATILDMLEHMITLRKFTRKKFETENEIVIAPQYSVTEGGKKYISLVKET